MTLRSIGTGRYVRTRVPELLVRRGASGNPRSDHFPVVRMVLANGDEETPDRRAGRLEQ
ncbi:hypothetical protein ABZY81_38455 [Streptomyces sp. NPDC006514]|uniref:hypothetical protein n=1 Tax=Streptomyces sp. NPDC006514 TaxID=3154308 RepID=UPI00339F0D47